MNSKTSLLLVGIGGYGNSYVSALLDSIHHQNLFSITGAVDPNPAACERLGELKSRGVQIHPSLESFYSAGQADMAVICSPLHLHADQTCFALEHGSHILCEKPLCATPDQAKQMAAAQKQAKKHVGIGYQWSYSRAIQQLKADILAGTLGKPIRLRTLSLWPRDEAYYLRNRWAGRKRDANGTWILDSPVNNACAHHLHNMLYILGDKPGSSVVPQSLVAELYRGHAIENYDTAAVRAITRDGVQILFIVSHVIDWTTGPDFQFEFERATVEFADGEDAVISARFRDGTIKNYGSPQEERMQKLWWTIEAIHRSEESLCGIDAASAHTRCVWAIQQSMPEITQFDPATIDATGPAGHRKIAVRGLAAALRDSYDRWKLPSELGLPWARAGNTVAVES
jgi:predicted dehydrogenase